MRSRCIARLASRKSHPIAPTQSPAHSTWNLICNFAATSARISLPITERIKNMDRILALALAVMLAAVSAFAADGKPVSYKSGDETVQGILYTPSGKGPFPGLVVIHEYWGLNDWVKEQASKLADQGYVSLAVDLYRGKVATTPDMAHELMRGVAEDRAARDLHAAVEFLKSQSSVKKDRIASIGWCMGGGYSLNEALQEPTLTAAVINF